VRAAGLDDCGTGFDIVVNASASSATGAPVPVSADVLGTGALALDMMYGPLSAGFLAWARGHGAVGRDGLGMLVEQAAEAFRFWRGVEPETAPVLAALRQRLDPA
jgi:shikimate dehydrogenase